MSEENFIDDSHNFVSMILKNNIFCLHKVIRKSDNKIFLRKQFFDHSKSNSEWEIRCYEEINYSNIVKNCIFLSIYFPYNNGDLFSRKFLKLDLDENLSKNIFKKLLQSLKYIHSKEIIHKNINMTNILLDENNNPHFTGFSKTGEESNLKAPETILHGKFSEKTDIFSLGIVLFEMITGALPFQEAVYRDWWYNKIIKKNYDLFWKAHESNGNKYNEDFKDLINKIFCNEPIDRPSIIEIQNHKWMVI